jgi:DNA polymerase-4
MPMKKAMQLCPHAFITSSGRDQYSKFSRWVTDIIASKVPLFEKPALMNSILISAAWINFLV